MDDWTGGARYLCQMWAGMNSRPREGISGMWFWWEVDGLERVGC